jgi:hypothetical protein
MAIEGQTDAPPSKKGLALITGGALLAATAIAVCFVLPAEFQLDPTGFGRLTGLYKLGTPQPKTVAVTAPAAAPATRFYPAPYRSDTVEIPLTASGDPNHADELEYKVRMKAGDSLVYAWTVEGVTDPEMFYYDFHGETPAGEGAPEAKVIEYKQATGLSSNGVLIAPIPGVHGWYLQNQSVKPVVVKLKLSGFYALIPPGKYGNEAGIVAKPASDAFR